MFNIEYLKHWLWQGKRRWLAFAVLGLLLFKLAPYILPGKPFAEHYSSSTAVYDAEGRLLRLTLARDDTYRQWLPLKDIAPEIKQAVLLHEDRYFYFHLGVNPISIVRAAWDTYVAGPRRIGGSTITMQVARLHYRLHSRSFPGKLAQIARAIQLELTYSKPEIFEAYLNLLPYGRNIEGVGAASQIYLGKPANNLTLGEALTLAVIPQSPVRRAPGVNANRALADARNRLFDAWVNSHPDAREQAELIKIPVLTRDIAQLPFQAPHFVNSILAEPRPRQSPTSRIMTTLDLKQQKLLERHIKSYVARMKRVGIRNASAMLLDTRDMSVKAVAGSADFFDATINGQVNGTQAKRSPGSTLKPFIYALGMDQGVIHPGSVLRDAPLSFGSFSPENFDGRFAGPLTAKDALIRSRNIPAVSVAAKLSNPSLYSFLKSAGVSRMAPEAHYGLALVLGGGEVSMEELATLYAALANHGVLKPLRTTLDAPQAKGTRLLSEEASYLALDMLKDTPRPEQAQYRDWVRDPLPVSWKTGTSYGFRDAWTVGIFGPYVLAVWVGNFDGEANPAFVGIQAAAPLFFEIADSIKAQTHLRQPPYRLPKGLARVEVCAVSGQIPGAHCHHKRDSWFIPGKSPIKVCDIHREVVVDNQTGRQTCPPYAHAVHKEVFEFWSSDMLRVFRQAGIPRRAPPTSDARCAANDHSSWGAAPQITSPLSGVAYSLRAAHVGEETIAFQATTDADAQFVFWFVNENLVGKSAADAAFHWKAAPGSFVIRAVDDQGRADARALKVELVK
ncbi:MAG: penicillin-binding protein 1C [Pseudomonadota bacterium]